MKRFEATGSSGKFYTVHVYETVIGSTLIGKQHGTARGTREERLSDGRHLEWIDDDTFKIIDTGERIRRVTL